LAGGKVVPKPVICKVHRVEEPDWFSEKYSSVSPACAVTHALSKKIAESKSNFEEDVSYPTKFDLSETFICGPDFSERAGTVRPLKEERVPTVNTSMSRKQLIAEQRTYEFDRDDVLMRKL
jgi:hypothetical protein